MPRSKPLQSQKRSETLESLAQREWLRDFVRFAKGDPQLSSFEEGFINSMVQLAETPNGPLPNAEQAEIIQQLATKFGYGATDRPASLPQHSEERDEDDYEG
jgi:hypothetical protein